MMALKRKILLYERLLKEKTRENTKLLEDKKIVEASETRKLTEKLENECQRLRVHLAQSVPETEFLKEKDQYLTIINRLIDENMHLRQVVGKFEHKRKESEKLLTELGGGEALVRQFRTMSINTRKQANFYKKALNNLMTKGKQSLQSSRRRPTLASTTSSVSGKLKNQNLNKSQSSLNNFNLRKEIPSELNLKNSKRRASSLENSKASKSVNNEPTNLKNVENESLGILLDSEGPPSINNTNFNEKSPSNQPTPQSNRSLITCVRRTQRSNSENSKIGFPKKEEFEEQNVEEEEENEKKSDEDLDFKHFEDSEEEGEVEEDEKEGKEDEEDEEEEEDRDEESIHQVSEESDEKEIEDMENEETHLNALYRLISSHILRQQMCKVREERDHYSKQMVVGILQQEQQNYYW